MALKLNYKISVAITGLLVLLSHGCAKVGNPTGGPMDVTPPQYVGGLPENRSTNFTGNRIDIAFDEYIQLKDQNREVLISPPSKEKPLIRVREKSLRVTLNNELLPRTTYTVNFGNALSDLNESNTLPDFDFVFSTGGTIDSLSVTGKVLNAFNHKPEKEGGMLIMLYENLSDSIPLLDMPKYYGRANKNGLFAVNNIHPDTFNIIAVKDANNNMLYDPTIEEIAFLDSLLIINAENVISQTYIKDTVKIITPAGKQARGNRKDKIQEIADTVIAPGKLLNARDVSLYYFLEKTNRVFLTSRNRESAERFSFIFNRPLFDTLQVYPLNFTPVDQWFIKEVSRNNDSIAYWITDTLIARMDTLKLKLSYMTTDSSGRFIERIDTINMRISTMADQKEKGVTGRRPRGDAVLVKKKALKLSGSVSNRGTQNLNKPVVFTLERPLQKINPDSIEFYKLVDTLVVKQLFTCYKDSFSLRKFRLECKWEEDCKYKLLLKPGTAVDIYGRTNDTLAFGFITQKADYYGTIILTLISDRYPMIIQVLSEKGEIVNFKRIIKSGVTIFDYLAPGKYILKAIYDENNNGEWDTGNYLKHIQPEKIFLSNTTIQLRSNWENQVSWEITE